MLSRIFALGKEEGGAAESGAIISMGRRGEFQLTFKGMCIFAAEMVILHFNTP